MLRRTAFAAFLMAAQFLATVPASAGPPETLTLFHHCERAWGVGTIHLSRALTYRDGQLLVFPAQFTDLVWGPNGTKPRNMMLVHELWPDDKDKPFLQDKEVIFAPVTLLPEHSYYKDNIPFTQRHQISGGRRYVFRGEQIPEVTKIVGAYMAAHDKKGMDRWKDEVVAVAAALESTIPFVREDAVTWFTVFPSLARDFDDRAIPSIKAYLGGSAPADEKAKLIGALDAAKIESVRPLLQETAKRQDAAGAAALRSLGEKESTEALLEKSRSTSPEVQAFALEQLGARAGSEDAAFARCKEIVDDVTNPPAIGDACLRGLGSAKGDRVEKLLVSVVERGDNGSRTAAVLLADSGDPKAQAELTRILKEKEGEPAISAAAGLSRARACDSCRKTLQEQHLSHPDHSVRDLIGVLLGVPLVHKH